jgi:hypothetical protein
MRLSDSNEFVGKLVEVNEFKLTELRKLIAVTEPYYALSNLHQHDDVLAATLPLQQTNHLEPFGMGIPEIGRHMAILGSLALANANPVKEKHYYLATHAIVERMHNKPGSGGNYFGKVKVVQFNKRTGQITGELFNNFGELYCTIEVTYSVLHELVFNRMFAKEGQTTNDNIQINPYANPSTLYNLKLGIENSFASLGTIQKEHCVGHFKNFPALPIARLGGALTSLSGLHYNFIRNSTDRYCIRKAEIHAKTFVFAGRNIELFSQIVESNTADNMCIESYANTTDCCRAIDYKLWFFR